MENVISQLGVDLTDAVTQNSLPITDLDVPNIKVHGMTIPDYVIYNLVPRGGFRSILLVGRDVEYLNTYINAAAAMLSDPMQYKKYVESYCKLRLKRDSSTKVDELTSWMFNGLTKTRIRTLEVEKLVQLCDDAGETWVEKVIDPLINEENQHFVFAVDQITEVFSSKYSSIPYHVQSHITSAIRVRKLTFIAALSWEQYVTSIDGQKNRFCRPVLFTPRPENIALSPYAARLSPDHYHEFA